MIPQEPTTESLRKFLTSAIEKIDHVRHQLQNHDSRLRTLETGLTADQNSWNATTASADHFIAAITAAEISVRAFSTSGLDGGLVKQPLAAMPSFTSENLEELAKQGELAQFGAINMMQGYLGEERALNAINSGAVPVPEGRYATLAESSNQPGYDLMLLSESGATPIVAQVKISDSAGIIREHFLRYPEVGIVYTNSEAAQALVGDPSITVLRASDHFPDGPGRYVVDMGFSRDEIRAGAVDIMDGADQVSFGDQIQENIPWIALILIAGRAAYEYLDTDTSGPEIVKVARRRIRQSLLASGASTLTTAATTEPLMGTLAGVTTLFGGRAVGQAREDVRYAANRVSRMGAILRGISAQQALRSTLST